MGCKCCNQFQFPIKRLQIAIVNECVGEMHLQLVRIELAKATAN